MLEMFSYQFVWLAIVASVILAGIHAYLGFHIVSRGVIFVDLSLAQMGALGAIAGTMIGLEEDSLINYAVALLFTLLGAWIVSIARTRDERVPQEAFIGIIYAAAAATTILLLAHHPGGTEELQHMLAGSLLTVTPRELVFLTVTYGLIGVLHYALRSRFFLITRDREAAIQKGWNTTGWDFVFYATFGIVVTSAVKVAGVFLVFSFLVVPPVIAVLLTDNSTRRLIVGWIVALVGSVGGIVVSVGFNLPAGPSIIIFLVAILIVVVLAKKVRG